jgi:hypothetical protein
MREMRYRQRNIVFPETAMNGARFWRNLNSRKYPFRTGQKFCFAIFLLTLGPCLFACFLWIVADIVRSESSVLRWIADVPLLAFFAVDAVLLFRAFSAVFAEVPALPELPLSVRQNMIDRSRRFDRG